MALKEYRRKRAFDQTPEPAGGDRSARGGPRAAKSARFVVQKHAARRLHYDLRLEIDGVLKSWAVPKGPSLNPKDKRLAVMTEDHPLEYGDFEGIIPEGNYGAGTVIVWDTGEYVPEGSHSASEQLAKGEIKFSLRGKKLGGSFVLVRLKPKPQAKTGNKTPNDWLLIKHDDAHADSAWDVNEHTDSAVTGRTLDEVRQGLPPDQGGATAGAESIESARATPLPADAQPMLGTLVAKPFSDPDWVFEVKWDGIRALASVDDGECRLRSRLGNDITDRYPELEALAGLLRVRQAVLDGEIVVLDAQGRGDFERLQSRMHVATPSRSLLSSAPITYYVFDLLYCDGYDLREAPLVERKRLLRQVLTSNDRVRYSDHVAEKGTELFELAEQHGAEGIVGKQAHSPYVGGRSPYWVKLKVTREVDAVVGGFTSPSGGRAHFGALLVGLYEGRWLRFVGGVGSGFNEDSLAWLGKQLKEREVRKRPFAEEPETKGEPRWVKPELVARVKFSSWTREQRLRAPVFLGLRDDIDAKDCLLETEQPAEPAIPKRAPVAGVPHLRGKRAIEAELFDGKSESVVVEIGGTPVRLTNLNKVYFPESGYTKRDLLAYYYRVADLILPFMKGRPLVLHRYPNGAAGDAFYQKAAAEETPDWMETEPIYSEERKRDIPYLMASSQAALLYLANLGCIEQHPWSSSVPALESPDYVFFDLDPTDGTPYDTVVEVARGIHRILERIGVTVFLKTSGATGFHMWLPLEAAYDYEQIRAFAEIVARVVAAQMPDVVTLERSIERRGKGRVYVDYSQNAQGRPLATVYSVRPFPLATVSAPMLPRELRRGLRPERFTIKTMPARIAKVGDLWAGFWKSRQPIEPAIEKLRAEIRDKKIQL